MSNVYVKIVSLADPRTYVEKDSNYLLNIEVLETLKQAIKQAKDASRMEAKNDRK